ncbi:uncharacterized protein [Anser cygnoides]|uniref:uncharacterized protein isoform X3 n=1 Tax=Anser cygnoides TaxID=8845 RepID=UPI0034D2B9C9
MEIHKMDEVYKISSTEKVQQLERELAAQLAELKAQIEDNGVLQGTPSRAYSSVQVPKDVTYFRKEREIILKKVFQVTEAKPLVIQADVMQRELESCWRREYTAASLPLLLHQFFTDRITQLVQSKYLHMLRWKRFCTHSSVIEQLYPLYQQRVSYIMEEYNDAVQRAARLSAARENFLTGKKNPVNVVTQEDLMIYTQWLVCHLHSLKGIHRFLQILQHLPASHRLNVVDEKCPDMIPGNWDKLSAFDTNSESCHKVHPVSLPQHSTETEELRPQLQLLMAHFGIDYNLEDLKNPANEMELFSLVVKKFRSVFCKQQTMRTFPVYDAEASRSDKWGMLDPTRALKKRANWVPFLKIKPKVDPWQQKLLIKLKQWRKVDKMMDLHSKFVEVSDMERVMEGLQNHAAVVLKPHALQSSSATSHASGQPSYDHIWKEVYAFTEHHQELSTEDDHTAVAHGEEDVENTSSSKPPGSYRKRSERGYSYMSTLQLLGLEEGTTIANKEHVVTRGTYLSFLLLRHLRLRELKRVCLGILNYFRSVERSLTISTSGLSFKAGHLIPSAEDTSWVNAAKGGTGVSGGLRSQPYIHYTPADYKVHSAQFMEFAEVENHDDFHTREDGYIHTQDQRGAYIIYDVALEDLKELENQMLLVASQYIEKDKSNVTCGKYGGSKILGWAHASVDRFAVLLDLWTCETALLEKKCQLLDVYFEAYQHALDPEERFALAQAITDIMHKHPRFDLKLEYFVNTYKDECICLQLHHQLLRDIVNQQIDVQRDYVHKIWQKGQKGGISEFGLPYNVIAKQLISLNTGHPTLKNIYLLEFHPSLGLVSLIPKVLEYIYQEFYSMCRPKTASKVINLEKQLLQLVLDEWLTMEKPQSFYSSQIQEDLFADVLIEDPMLVQEIAFSLLGMGADEERMEGRGRQFLMLDSFSTLLELVTLRHRLVEVATESAQLARLYKAFAMETGFGEFHLYLRPAHFESAVHKEKADHLPPIFITSLLEDDSCVDRYIPSSLPLSIQEIDSHIGNFSFRTRDAVMQLLCPSGIKNMQLILACQVTQKNALLAAVQQASFCYLVQPAHTLDIKGGNVSLTSQRSSASGRNSVSGSQAEDQLLPATTPDTSFSGRSSGLHRAFHRPPEAFVSIQLEKLGPRDMMLNTFIQKKEMLGSRMQNPDEVLELRRDIIAEYCLKVNERVSQHALRGQLIAYYNSLRSLLDDFPVIRDKYFIIGLSQGKKEEQDLKENLVADPRSFHPRPHHLLSSDGLTFLNLWFIPHPAEVLIMFKMLPEKAALRALHLSLEIVGAFHDVVSYLLAFAQLGNSPNSFCALNPEPLTPDWGGTERIGSELLEIQKMIDSLQNPLDPSEVAQLLAAHREVMFLQFDAAIRHRLRETFLSSGNVSAYQNVTDRISHALPPLSNSVIQSAFSSQLRLPQFLDPQSCRTLMHFPWRTFLMDGGLFPVTINNSINVNYNMQLCLCNLSDADRRVAHGELTAMQFLMEDVLQNCYSCAVEDHNDCQASLAKSKQNLAEMIDTSTNWLQSSKKMCKLLLRHQDPVLSCNLLRSFLILWKQLEMLKAEWGRLKLRTEDINTVPLYKEFCEQYGTDILHPAMKAIARQVGTEEDFGGPVTSTQRILPPKGASEIEMKVYQLRKLLESLEIHMIHDVQKKIKLEMTLVTSERARQESSLPTELWKHRVMQENFSVVRPQIVETFVQSLMENYQESDTEVTFKKSHLQQCLTVLGCDIMARERSNFETYSMFYENILQQLHHLLYQKEQELHAVEEGGNQGDTALMQIAGLSHGMIMEITALRAQVADLEEENLSLKEKIRKEVRDEYESLVQNLFVTCVHLKGKLDVYRLSIEQRVLEIISEVRREGVGNMIDLKKKFGSSENNGDLKEYLSKEQLQLLQDENIRLSKLVCKLKALNHWKQTTQKARLSAKLRDAEKEAIQNKKECLNAKMMAEQEVTSFEGQLTSIRKALVKSQADNDKLKKLLHKQKQMLLEMGHQMTQEARKREILSAMKAENVEKMLEEMEEKEQRLECLTKGAEKSSKIGQLQQKRVKKEMQEIGSQLTQECSFKLETFQHVDELPCQVYGLEASQRNVTAGSAAQVRRNRPPASTPLLDYKRHPSNPDPRSSTVKRRNAQRPKTVPSRWKESAAERPLPHLNEKPLPTVFLQLQEQRLVQK